MKVAIVYHAKEGRVTNIFGMPNKEWYPLETISLVAKALEKSGHTVKLIQGDANIIPNLEEFLPRISEGKELGIVFNLALGIQGKCRYTHIPAILEASGIPYTGSSPLGHALALDKVIAKQIFIATGLPTPDFTVFNDTQELTHALHYPIVVKPRSEAASLGLTVVRDEKGLKEALADILETFKQPALAERYIEGRELNVSIYGNAPPLVLPVLEVQMEGANPNVFSHDLKFNHTGTRVRKVCPAKLPPGLSVHIQELALRAYQVLNIYDHARVDIRLDKNNNPFLLELNSMVSVNPTSSLVYAAKSVGIDYDRLINEILDAAVRRYAQEAPDIFGKFLPLRGHP
jgi:D-alanine-D-alanine ligase